jgi:Transposase DDE domain
MDANSSTIGRFKAQANKFSGIISKGLSIPKKNLVKQLIYGIQASKDIKLSNISRALQEDIPLIKTEDRLSRNLMDVDFTETINNQILRLGEGKITDAMVIAIDPGDIMKPYAKEMENLCNIWDGSEGEPAKGYHLCQVTAANLEHDRIVPLYCEAYSSAEEGYTDSTDKVIQIIDKVIAYTQQRGTWAIDRMGDNNKIIQHFVKKELSFVTRLKKNRWLGVKNKNGGDVQVQCEHLEKHMKLNHKAQITKIENGKESIVSITFGSIEVTIPDIPNQTYTAVVIKGFGKIPMVLITNKTFDVNEATSTYKLVEIYLTRWKCDECFRYIKQSYNLEDIRVRSYIAIRNMLVIVHAIAYFTSIYMGISLKLKFMVQKIFILSKRFFGVPSFFNYAMADGIFELLKTTRTGFDNLTTKCKSPFEHQLNLFPD